MKPINQQRINNILKIVNSNEIPISEYGIAKKLTELEGKKVTSAAIRNYLEKLVETKQMYQGVKFENGHIQKIYSEFPIEKVKLPTTNEGGNDYYIHIETAFGYIQSLLGHEDPKIVQSAFDAWELIVKGLGYSFNDENMDEDECMAKLIALKEGGN